MNLMADKRNTLKRVSTRLTGQPANSFAGIKDVPKQQEQAE
jgi:hypothetical protein